MNPIIVFVVVGSTIIITISFLSIFFNVVQLYGQEQESNNSNYNYSDYNQDINAVIGEGVKQCSYLQKDSCIAVMDILNEICQIAYFPTCFGEDEWGPFMNYLKNMNKEGHIVREDDYITLNNEHFQNDGSIELDKSNGKFTVCIHDKVIFFTLHSLLILVPIYQIS